MLRPSAFPRWVQPTALLVLLLAAAELALRAAEFDYSPTGEGAIVWSRERDREMRAGRDLLELDPHEVWRPRPGAELPWAPGETINADGFRGAVVPRERTPGVLRIATMGADSAFGTDLAWGETWSGRLAAELEALGTRAEVIGAGVPSSTIRQGIERWRRHVSVWRPHVVVLAWNGIHEHRPALRGCSDAARIEEGCGMPDLHAEEQGRAWTGDDLRVPIALAWLVAVTDGSYWELRDRELRQMRMAGSFTTFENAGVRRVPVVQAKNLVVAFVAELRGAGVHPVGLGIPRRPGSVLDSRVMDAYHKVMLDSIEQAGFPVVRGRTAFGEEVRAGRELDELFRDDALPTAAGHAILARMLARELSARAAEYGR